MGIGITHEVKPSRALLEPGAPSSAAQACAAASRATSAADVYFSWVVASLPLDLSPESPAGSIAGEPPVACSGA